MAENHPAGEVRDDKAVGSSSPNITDDNNTSTPFPLLDDTVGAATTSSSVRGRRRSNSVRGESPFAVPISTQETELAALIKQINLRNEAQAANKPAQAATTTAGLEAVSEEATQSTAPIVQGPRPYSVAPATSSPSRPYSVASAASTSSRASDKFPDATPPAAPKIGTVESDEAFIDLLNRASRVRNPTSLPDMSFQGPYDSASTGPSNSRQAPPSPSQQMNHGNGMNGAMGIGPGMVGFPTPAGHQADLNFIMSMVEELSKTLQLNKELTGGVIDKMGQVREKAKVLDLDNDEVISLAAKSLNLETQNLEKELSATKVKLAKAEYDRDENWKLVIHGCNILADIKEKMHKFKEQNDADVLAWHKNYRQQLADEREINLGLNNRINDMIASAARANGHLRDMRRHITDHPEMHELRVQNQQYRLERRYWKRMALPLIPDDDPSWSDDDDIIDPEEKKRQMAAEVEKGKGVDEGA